MLLGILTALRGGIIQIPLLKLGGIYGLSGMEHQL